MRLARLLPLALSAAMLIAGCGSSGDSGSTAGEPTATATTPAAPPGASARVCMGAVAGTGDVRVTGIGCDVGRGIVAAWASKPGCRDGGESRVSCSVYKGYRCLGAATERGINVSCYRPGSSVAFLAGRHRGPG